jgi:negative regulator of flagellin synthesis FlgM
MKIDKSNNGLPPSSLSESSTRTTPPKAAETQAAPKEGVNVSLGSTASQLRSMGTDMTGAPPVDAKKVAEIKQAISEGRFQINSGAIADNLINNVEEMINASQS